MKPLKKANQRNAELNKDYYTRTDLEKMLSNHEVFFFNEGYSMSYNTQNPEEEELRVDLFKMKEIKVILDPYGYYTTVCVDNEGRQYYVNL